MGRVGGVSRGHRLSVYIKLNDKPKSKRTRKFKEWNEGFLGQTDSPTRFDVENLTTGSY